MQNGKPVALIIMDGWGIRKSRKGNAIAAAHTPNFDRFWKNYPYTQLKASGEAVGLPKNVMGNSEVGHIHLGAGRLIPQELVMLNNAIKSKSFFKNKMILAAMKNAGKKGAGKKGKHRQGALHLMGLVSDGCVHSHISHLFALLELAKKQHVKRVFVHCFLDGRDVPQKSALKYITQLQAKMKSLHTGEIPSIIGRYYSMDRDNRWNREHKAYDVMVNDKGYVFDDPVKAIKAAYKRGETDEFVKPTNIYCKKCRMHHNVEDGDSVIFFNFRSDRARQITRAFVEGRFNNFRRKKMINLFFVSLTEYDKKIKEAKVAFQPKYTKNILAEVLEKHKIRQLRIAETEKYAHVTFFFNNGREVPFSTEGRILIPSPKVATYDLKPEMSAYEIKRALLKEIANGKYKVIILNFANCDMVGHTGIYSAAVKAVETVDKCMGDVVDAVLKKNGTAIVTADHGNAEEMIGVHKTSHTTNPVPCIIVSNKKVKMKNIKYASLQNIAPTILKLAGVEKPKEMAGSLI